LQKLPKLRANSSKTLTLKDWLKTPPHPTAISDVLLQSLGCGNPGRNENALFGWFSIEKI
jgi:hypothetical protein